MGNALVFHFKDEARAIEHEREEGQALLREMVLSSSTVDWAAVIAKANELHTKEQEWIRQHNRRERRMFRRVQRRALLKRRRYDSCGSFSVNMLTFRVVEEEEQATHKSSTSDVGTLSHDDQSYGSGLSVYDMTRSHDEGMEPIDEHSALLP